MKFLFRIMLGLPAILAFAWGFGVLSVSRSAIQETVGAIGILIGAVFFIGYMIVESISRLHEELPSKSEDK